MWVRLTALGALVVASFVVAVFLLSGHPTPSGGLVNPALSHDSCDTVIGLLLYGQVDVGEGDQPPASTAPDNCEDLARVPGAIGLAVTVIGLAAAAAWIAVFHRSRRGKVYGAPISRAKRSWPAPPDVT